MSEEKKVVSQKRKPIRKFFKSFVNVKAWVSYDEIKSNTKNTWSLFQRLIYRGPKEGVRQETYEEAVIRLGLTPEQLLSRKRNFLYSALLYEAFAVAFFIYFIYLLVNLKIIASCLTLILVVLMSVVAYREHFWYMQMQKKKLGCNFKDWVGFILKRSV